MKESTIYEFIPSHNGSSTCGLLKITSFHPVHSEARSCHADTGNNISAIVVQEFSHSLDVLLWRSGNPVAGDSDALRRLQRWGYKSQRHPSYLDEIINQRSPAERSAGPLHQPSCDNSSSADGR